jgi:putative transposase
MNKKHLERQLKEYIENYYNTDRTHQGINCETPIQKQKPLETKVAETVLYSEPILGSLYHNYKKVA